MGAAASAGGHLCKACTRHKLIRATWNTYQVQIKAKLCEATGLKIAPARRPSARSRSKARIPATNAGDGNNFASISM